MARKIEVFPYDLRWPELFEMERKQLADVFGDALESIHHIGSTAVPGLSAKPVIDILAVVRRGTDVPGFDDRIRALGYRVRGECLDSGGTKGRYYYNKPVAGKRTHHLHVCEAGHFQIPELIRFVQYLRENDEVAAEYERLKRDAAVECAHDNVGYMARKHAWVRATVRAALAHFGEPDLRRARMDSDHSTANDAE